MHLNHEKTVFQNMGRQICQYSKVKLKVKGGGRSLLTPPQRKTLSPIHVSASVFICSSNFGAKKPQNCKHLKAGEMQSAGAQVTAYRTDRWFRLNH